ncbi:hypothetical protein KY289_031470 [Solanum tuberosum]|nr:hypothetical protein KY289_031470 [Solanum tuberosum]
MQVEFSKHEGRFQEDKVQKWRAALEEAANISGWDLPNTANGQVSIMKPNSSSYVNKPEARVIEKIAEDIMTRLGTQRHASNARNLVGMELTHAPSIQNAWRRVWWSPLPWNIGNERSGEDNSCESYLFGVNFTVHVFFTKLETVQQNRA